MSKNFRGQASGPPRRTEKRGIGKGEGRVGGIGLHYFSDQSYAPTGKHTSNNRSTTRSTTVLLVVLNVVCRVPTVTSHQQETVSKNDSRFNHANKQFFAQTAARRPMVGGGGVRLAVARRLISVGGGGVRNSAACRHRRGVDL
jgi:hypothetical protein